MAPLHFEPPPDDSQGSTGASIPEPNLPSDDPRYQGECQEALRPHLEELIARALAAKWNIRAVAYAVMMMGAQRLPNHKEPSGPEKR
jgi:hypothetical protein